MLNFVGFGGGFTYIFHLLLFFCDYKTHTDWNEIKVMNKQKCVFCYLRKILAYWVHEGTWKILKFYIMSMGVCRTLKRGDSMNRAGE